MKVLSIATCSLPDVSGRAAKGARPQARAASATSKWSSDMTPSIPENFWLIDWNLVTIIGSTPPRDPDDDDDDEDEEDEEDEDQDDEPAVIREPDE
jgi:hypothetical protein